MACSPPEQVPAEADILAIRSESPDGPVLHLPPAANPLARATFETSPGPRGFVASNPAHGLSVAWTARGTELQLRASDEPVVLALTGYGRDALAALPPAPFASESARLSSRRGAVLEWWKNRPEGLEQGFELAQAPPGGHGSWVRIEVSVAGATAHLVPGGQAIALLTADGRRLRYSGLQVTDAKGRTLPAALDARAQTLVLSFDDSSATYPVLVDPIIGNDFGAAVSKAGDINRDGFSDFLVGAPTLTNVEMNEGRVLLFLGTDAGMQRPPTWQYDGNELAADLGRSVAGVGDVNCDGYPDILVGVPGSAPGGKALLFYGSAAGLPMSPSWSMVATAANPGARLGASVAGAGDVNHDGCDDIIIGAPLWADATDGGGRAFVFYGSDAGVRATANWNVGSNVHGEDIGAAVSSAGDVNGDGFADIIIGAPNLGDGGAAFVFLGGDAGLALSPSWAVGVISQIHAAYGTSLASIGDFNKDGYGDIIVGAPLYDDPQVDEGRIYVYLGSPTGLSSSATVVLESDQDYAHMGASVASADDHNGDGFADAVVGAPLYDDVQIDEGGAFVIYGDPSGFPTLPISKAESHLDGAFFGSAVSGVGDINADGYDDFLVGAPGADAGGFVVWFLGHSKYPPDAGADAGVDAGGTVQNGDAGTPDAGTPVTDAGVTADAGPPGDLSVGCHCTSVEGAWPLLLALWSLRLSRKSKRW
jgi:hypothetical protein